jgi:hypothetical protein
MTERERITRLLVVLQGRLTLGELEMAVITARSPMPPRQSDLHEHVAAALTDELLKEK